MDQRIFRIACRRNRGSILENVDAPFAFQFLYISRVGRRSLLYRLSLNPLHIAHGAAETMRNGSTILEMESLQSVSFMTDLSRPPRRAILLAVKRRCVHLLGE